MLAVGPEQDATVALAEADRVVLSPHLGDVTGAVDSPADAAVARRQAASDGTARERTLPFATCDGRRVLDTPPPRHARRLTAERPGPDIAATAQAALARGRADW